MNTITKALLEWYDIHKRSLPWRDTVTPYRSLISEVMLQQTRVETVKPFFAKFMRTFPTVEALAQAPQDQVLAHWSGLGYYSRARNLHKAAKQIVEQGAFPNSLDDIRALPGVGPYIAGAIASIAFNIDTPAVDGNHHRVLSRLYRHPGKREEMWSLAEKLLPTGRCGDFNQALMDLGSQICTNKKPTCQKCPLSHLCKAYLADETNRFPVKAPKKKRPTEEYISLRMEKDNAYLLAQRPNSGLYGGLYEPPMVLVQGAQPLTEQLTTQFNRLFGITVTKATKVATVEHILTHKKMIVHIFSADPSSASHTGEYQKFIWHSKTTLDSIGVSTLASKVLKAVPASSQLSLFPTTN